MDYITSILLVTLFMYVISSFCKSWTLPHLDSSSSLPPVSVCSVSVSVWAGGEGRGGGRLAVDGSTVSTKGEEYRGAGGIMGHQQRRRGERGDHLFYGQRKGKGGDAVRSFPHRTRWTSLARKRRGGGPERSRTYGRTTDGRGNERTNEDDA